MDWKDTEAQLKCSSDETHPANNQDLKQALRNANLGEFRKIATDCIKILQKTIFLKQTRS
jgi:hypothetical protein